MTANEVAISLYGMNNREAWRALGDAADRLYLTGGARQIWMQEVWRRLKEIRRVERAERRRV